MRDRTDHSPISVGFAGDGSLLYLVACNPSDLPPVRASELENAWHAAHDAAIENEDLSPPPRRFRFDADRDGTVTDLTLTDRDALAWAAALDRRSRLTTRAGLSLLLRLLGLVDLLGSARWAVPLCTFRRDGALLDRRLLQAASRLPLTTEGRLDETGMRDAALTDAAVRSG